MPQGMAILLMSALLSKLCSCCFTFLFFPPELPIAAEPLRGRHPHEPEPGDAEDRAGEIRRIHLPGLQRRGEGQQSGDIPQRQMYAKS